jgi:hypothetical protein
MGVARKRWKIGIVTAAILVVGAILVVHLMRGDVDPRIVGTWSSNLTPALTSFRADGTGIHSTGGTFQWWVVDNELWVRWDWKPIGWEDRINKWLCRLARSEPAYTTVTIVDADSDQIQTQAPNGVTMTLNRMD